jgi:hypothetical protein
MNIAVPPSAEEAMERVLKTIDHVA